MYKSRNYSLAALLFAVLTGCDGNNTNGFVGHWVEVSGTESKYLGASKPMTLDISYSENVFHIDESKNVLGKDFERKLEGRSESSTTLSALGGSLTMRLENSKLFYNGRVLVKSP